MAISAISSGSQLQQAAQLSSPHKHGRAKTASVSDVDAQSSSVASAAPSTGGVGKKLNVTV
jgi:hypothetical protein